MRDLAKFKVVSRVVTEAITADFEKVKILNVKVERDIDFDGDDILKIVVVFEGTRKDIDARKVSGAVRHVRPKLTAIGERAFPLLSFISVGDAGMGKLEPA